MKKSIFSLAALLLAACTAFISCNTEILQPDDNSAVSNGKYTLTVVATKGDAATKALTLSDKTLNATWSEGDVVEVYENDIHLGTLTTSNFSSDYRTCTLSCELTTPPTGNTLTLKYRSQNYTSQDGTLAYIASYCDYAEASVNVTVSGNTITSSAANFVNQQAIVKFVLKDESGNTLSPTELTIANGTTTVASLPSINSAIYEATANGPGTLFVAIPEVSDEDLSLTAVSSGKTYVFKKSAVTLSNGTYKIINVKMFNEIVTPLTFEAKTAGATVTLTAASSSSFSFGENVQYSTDGSTWKTYTSGEPITLTNVGDKVRFRGTLESYGVAPNMGSTFSVSDDCYVYGNVMSLIGGDNFENSTELTKYNTFYKLFSGATAIRNHTYKTLALPATKLYGNDYSYMFEGCTGLTSAPALPARTLTSNCYRNMFDGCTALTSAPALPAETATYRCYSYMFSGCTALTSAPALPAETLNQYCYEYMFNGCSALTSAPASLPAKTLTDCNECYSYMFNGCTALTSAPTISAETLCYRCCYHMFGGCTSLTDAPVLSATTLAQQCYYEMFYGCSNLTSLPASLPATTLADMCYSNMFQSCSSLITVPENFLPAVDLTGGTSCYYSMFAYCHSLTTTPKLPATKLEGSCYSRMFYGCSSLTTTPDLDATSLASYCYKDMFGDCNNLTTVQVLPATALATGCYNEMFTRCTSLKSLPDGFLPATDLSSANECYRAMFYQCTNLETAPTLPATTLSDNCYLSMFSGCTNLTTAPTNLPALTLTEGCYKDMFYNCSNLTNAPVLPAATLTKNCYYRLFYYCSKIDAITCLATDISAENCTKNWVDGVKTGQNSGGIFTKSASMTAWPVNSANGIPNGWSVVDMNGI